MSQHRLLLRRGVSGSNPRALHPGTFWRPSRVPRSCHGCCPLGGVAAAVWSGSAPQETLGCSRWRGTGAWVWLGDKAWGGCGSLPENVQNGLVEGDSSVLLINEGGKAELVGSLHPSGGCSGVPISEISHPCAGWSDSEPVENFWGFSGIQSWGGVFPIMVAPILSHPCLRDVM